MPPPLEASWSAHDSAIVSVEYIEHDHGVFVLTASTDKTARLWSLQGEYIGTFGQVSSSQLELFNTVVNEISRQQTVLSTFFSLI